MSEETIYEDIYVMLPEASREWLKEQIKAEVRVREEAERKAAILKKIAGLKKRHIISKNLQLDKENRLIRKMNGQLRTRLSKLDSMLDDAVGLLHNVEQNRDPGWRKDYEKLNSQYDELLSEFNTKECEEKKKGGEKCRSKKL